MQVNNGTLDLSGNYPTIVSGDFSQQTQITSTLTNLMTLDSFFIGLNVTGQVDISLQLEDFPTASFSLITNSPSVANNLKNKFTNFNLKHIFYNIPFRVTSYNESISPSPNRRYEISIQMEGWNKYLVNKEVTLTFDSSVLYYTLSDVARKVGVNITNINKKIYLNGELKISTTLSNVINSLINDLGLDVDYTYNQIKLTKHGTAKTISISADKILNLQCSYNQANVEGFYYSPKYLDWNRKTEQDYKNEQSQLQSKPKYVLVNDKQTTVINDPENAAIPNGSTITLKNMSLNFDSSGETKTKEINVYEGQKIISTEVFTYGFVYLSSQLTQDPITGWYGDGKPFWQLIEHYIINYFYDDVDGYLLGHSKTGSKLSRFLTETDDGEHLQYKQESSDPFSQQTASLYEFRWIPITEEERYELTSYHSTYTDSQPDYEQVYQSYQEFDKVTGKYVTKYEKNLSYSIPMYISRRYTFTNSFAYTLEPKADSTDFTKFLTTGEQKRESYYVKVLDSKNTRNNANKDDDKYLEITSLWTSQDSNFNNSFDQKVSNTITGKPQQGQFYPVYKPYEVKNTESTSNDQNKYIVFSTGYSGNKIATDTVYFDVESKEDALFALKTQLEKQNTFNVNDFTFTTLFDLDSLPSYKLSIVYNGNEYKGIIKSVNIPITILDGTIAKCFMSVNCGRILPNNTVDLQLEIEQSDSKPDLFLPIPYTHGSTDDIVQIYNDIPQRINY